VPTRLTLDARQVDLVVEAGRRAVRENAAISEAVTRIRRSAGVRGAPWPGY